MSETLKIFDKFRRDALKGLLAQLEPKHHRLFKLMYGRDNGRRSAEDACKMDINEVVDLMPADKLDHATRQCENTIKKLANNDKTGSDSAS